MRDVAFAAVGVEQFLAFDAKARLERALRVVNAGMYDLGIARTGVGADCVFGLKQDDFAPGKREFAGDRKSDDTRTDDGTIDSFSHNTLPSLYFQPSICL